MSREPISDDPDVVQAVADFRGAVGEIRRRTVEASRLRDGDPNRALHLERIALLSSVIRLRAERLCMSEEALVLLVNADLDSRARRGRAEPARPTSRTLLTALTNAQARESQAIASLAAAKVEMAAAAAARLAAQEACTAHGAMRRAGR